MRRAVAAAAALFALVAAIAVLAEATQNRVDARVPGSRTTVEFTVSTRDYRRGDDAAAAALWVTCAATVGGDVSPVPEPVGGRWRAVVSPAIGDHGENRLVGCLEDVTLDRVVGDVLDLRSGQ